MWSSCAVVPFLLVFFFSPSLESSSGPVPYSGLRFLPGLVPLVEPFFLFHALRVCPFLLDFSFLSPGSVILRGPARPFPSGSRFFLHPPILDLNRAFRFFRKLLL